MGSLQSRIQTACTSIQHDLCIVAADHASYLSALTQTLMDRDGEVFVMQKELRALASEVQKLAAIEGTIGEKDDREVMLIAQINDLQAIINKQTTDLADWSNKYAVIQRDLADWVDQCANLQRMLDTNQKSERTLAWVEEKLKAIEDPGDVNKLKDELDKAEKRLAEAQNDALQVKRSRACVCVLQHVRRGGPCGGVGCMQTKAAAATDGMFTSLSLHACRAKHSFRASESFFVLV
jgi:chromosome segregation ATPase